ncbi:MAG: type II secretion system protein N [Granulosicoccus sp.]
MPSATELAREIASRHLFGNANAPVSVLKVKPVKVPLQSTRLNLQLTGVFASNPPEHAAAVITVSGKDQTTYRVGETIDQQTILEAVFPDHVVLRNRGALEKLELAGMQ